MCVEDAPPMRGLLIAAVIAIIGGFIWRNSRTR